MHIEGRGAAVFWQLSAFGDEPLPPPTRCIQNMNQRHFTRKYQPLPGRYYAIRNRRLVKALAPFVWAKAARIVRDRLAAAPDPAPNHYGMVFRGKFRNWDWLRKNTVCRQCRARIGQPVADPLTGKIDHEGISCYGKHEHEIRSEGDLMPTGQAEWLQAKAQDEACEVIKIYAPRPKSGLGKALYPAPVAGLD
jgi:hypothetical protein